MPRCPSNIISFPGGPRADGLVLSDADYELIVSAIGPCHGPEVEDFLTAAPIVPGGRRLNVNDPIMDDVLAAVGTEVHGYMKLDEERDGRARLKPKRGSTAERLLAVHDLIEQHLS
jgi:hypothetical protein